ncbi:hypothetical protein QDX81_04695 [Pseudomonas sp. CW003PS]|nr:hypothetical protein QDX81_04695 [Pseudomonas sp. CW003PS]
MNTETQNAYRSLASHFYDTRLPGIPVSELNELNIIGALLRAAPEYRPDYFRRLRNALALDQKLRNHFWIAQEINRTLNPVCGFHAIRPPSPLSSGQAFHGHLATCSTAIRPGSRSAAAQGLHC